MHLGFINVDNARYWDYQYITPFKVFNSEIDQYAWDYIRIWYEKRIDLVALKSGDLIFPQ